MIFFTFWRINYPCCNLISETEQHIWKYLPFLKLFGLTQMKQETFVKQAPFCFERKCSRGLAGIDIAMLMNEAKRLFERFLIQHSHY